MTSSRLSLHALALAIALQAAPSLAVVPSGFVDSLVFSLGSPTAIAFTPDGRMLVTRQSGTLRVRQGGTLLPTPALTIAAICSDFERGLLGVAVDPDFASNRYIYLFYTFRKFGSCPYNSATSPVNRVSRFLLPDSNVIDPASELVLVDNMPSPNGNHNAGDVQFGKDGHLYVTIGDGGCDYAGGGCSGSNDGSRDEHVLTGKLLRITRTGGIPADNPFQGAGTAPCAVNGSTTPGNRCQETYGWGLRNPFRIAFDPNDAGTRFFINDVGQNIWEEIDVGQAGADYGWNCREGAHTNNTSGPCNPTPPGMVDPIFEYQHNQFVPGTGSTGCNSITGGAFVPNGIWPSFDGAYLFSDYVCGSIFKLTQSGPVWQAQDFATSLGGSSAVHLGFGPYGNTQALYYTTFQAGGQIRVIHYSPAGNNPPVSALTASPRGGDLPLSVTLDGSGSTDPDAGAVLTFIFDPGDGSGPVTTASSSLQHLYTTAGPHTASLRVRDEDFAFSALSTVSVLPGNHLPQATITSPTTSQLFSVGETITLSATATDTEDGSLPAGARSWTVLLHHNTHTHPFLGPVTGNNVTFTAPPPEDLLAAPSSYLEIQLTVTDSDGLTTSLVQNLMPKTVSVTFATAPAGLNVTVNGTSYAGPTTLTSWTGYTLNVNAPNQSPGGTTYNFVSWSDGGAQSHSIVSPATTTTYTATFAIPNSAPQITSANPFVRFRGGPASSATLATVSDSQTPAGSLQVSFVSAPTGVTVTDLINTNGTITGMVAATCAASPAAGIITLQVSDGQLTANGSTALTVQQNATPPVVTPPAPAGVSVPQSTCAPVGATLDTLLPRSPAHHAALTALLEGGTATDDCDTPVRLTAQVAGVDITGSTLFPIGTTNVQLRFRDAGTNVGTATVTVTVLRVGSLDADGDTDVADNLLIMALIVGNVTAGSPPFVAPLAAADANGDGVVDLFDVIWHQAFLVGNVACALTSP